MRWRVEVRSPAELDQAAVHQWRELRASIPCLSSPFHDPDWFVALSLFETETKVVLAYRGDQLDLAVPFFDQGEGRTRAAGGWLADHQGITCRPGSEAALTRVLRGAGIRRFDFDHIPFELDAARRFARTVVPSPAIDVSAGFQSYLDQLRASGSSLEAWARRKRRILERDWGPLRFEAHESDPDVLDSLISWKSAQYQATGAHDFFANPTSRALLDDLLLNRPGFGLRVSTLRCGERLAAAHVGPASSTTWHWWFPSYDLELAAGSPGALLLMEVAQHAAIEGIRSVELGRGDEPYKQRMANRTGSLCVGAAISRPNLEHARRLVRGGARRVSALGSRLRTGDG